MTSSLEQRLEALGAGLVFPPAPDLVPAVLARLPDRRPGSGLRIRRGLPARRTLAVALAAVLLVAGAAMAIPSTRHAILRVLGLRGVTIERVPRSPVLPGNAGARLGLGERIPLARARHAASFTALLPSAPAAAYLGHDVPGGRISLLTGRVLIIEFRAGALPYLFKLIGPGTRTKSVRVNRGPGVYIFGAPHELLFRRSNGDVETDRTRLAGNVLVWQQGPLTVRIEGTRKLAQALSLARSLR